LAEKPSAEEQAYRKGAEDMRKAILEGFELLFSDDVCRCYRCLKAVITEVEW
jgi:hypothetical protein